MSLIAHYKLDGDALDNGGYSYDGITHGTLSYINGLFGQCLDLTGAANTGIELLRHNDAFKYQNLFSISMWFKSTSTTGATINRIVSRDLSDYWGWTADQSQAYPQDLRFYYSAGQSTLLSNTIQEGWNHFASTWDLSKNEVKFFANGEEVFSTSGFNGFTTAPRPIALGGNTEGDGDISGNEIIGEIDDVQLFNHALSKKEIKELSKGKVLHYKFDDFQEPTENVVTNTDLDTGWSKGYAQNILWDDIPPPPGVNSPVVSFENDDTGGGGYWYSYGDYAPQADGTTYTISLWVKTNQISNVSIRAYTGDNSETGRYNSEYRTVNSSEGWKRIVWDPFTTSSPNDSDSLSFKIEGHYENGYTRLWLCAPQMEAKAYATPFVDGSRTGTVLDSSSQDNNTDLVQSYTPQWVSDSKLGEGCYHLDGTGTVDGVTPGSHIDVNESVTDTRNYPEGVTYSFWLNVDTDATNRMSLFYGSSTIRHIELYSSSKYFRTEAAIQNGYSIGSSTFPDDVRGQWAHFAIVFANGETNRPVRWYQNGTLFHTGSMDGGANPGTEYFSFNKIGRSTGTTQYTYAQSFDGRIDDMRIYAIALTENDIRELYQTRASLDDGGTLHTVSINETGHKPLTYDYTVWENGQSGSVGQFSGYSDSNNVILSNDPWGVEVPIWESGEAAVGSTYPSAGRMYNSTVSVDNSKMYRMSFWEYRVTNAAATYARYYFGLNGYGSTSGVLRRDSGGTPNTNPYFHYSNNLPNGTYIPVGQWFLIVGHVWPSGSGTGAEHPDSGVWTLDGQKYSNLRLSDYTMIPETTTIRSRTLCLYRGDDPNVRHHSVYPRMDLVDGTEPSIADLLSGFDSNNIETVRSKGGTSNISLDIHSNKTDFGTISELGPTNGLVAYYPLDGNADDYSGDNDATTSSIVYGPGINKAARVSGSATAPTDPAFNVKGDMTLSFWFRPDASGARRVVMQTAYAGSFCINHETAGDLRFYNGDNSSYDSLDSSVLTNGQWYHCVAVRQGATKYWYLDGTLDISGGTSYDGGTRTDPLDIATGYTGNDIVGALDDVRIYNRALTSEEISVLYSITGPDQTKMKQTKNGLYVKGQFKETY